MNVSAQGPSPGARIGDAERERTVERLKEHAVAGRLQLDELAVRTEQAYAARTAEELEAVTRALPPAPRPSLLALAAARLPLRTHLIAFLVLNAILVVAWAVTRQRNPGPTDEGAGYLWPFWIMLAWGIVLVVHALYALRRPALRRLKP